MEAVRATVFIIVWLLLIPGFAGLLPSSLVEKKNRKISTIMLSGWLMELAVFEIIGTHRTVAGGSLSEVINVFTPVMGLAALFGALVFVSGFINDASGDFFKLPVLFKKDKENMWTWVLFVVLIVLQMVLAFFIAMPNGDDAYYVSVALSADKDDILFAADPYTGVQFSHQLKLSLAQFPIFIGFLSRVTGLHCAIVAHMVLPPVFLVLTYLAFYKVATELFRDDDRKVSVFMVIIAMIQLFGASSDYSNEVMLLTRTWQGKSIFANLVVPTVFYLVLCIGRKYGEEQNDRARLLVSYFFLLTGVNVVGMFASTLGALLLVIFEMIMLAVLSVRYKTFRIMYGILSSLPCLIYIMLYIIGE